MLKTGFRSVRGTHDFLPDDLFKRRILENELRSAVSLFGYREAETPVLEHSSLFERSLGTGSEVVSKEMFRLESRSSQDTKDEDTRMVLRPENTASMLRAMLNAGMTQHYPLHYYYCGPQFRYERPQKGRMRQFHQFGVECFGRSSASADAECILSAAESLKRLGLMNKTKLKINSLGESEEARKTYNDALMNHFVSWNSQRKELSRETQLRIQERRLLRALDSKHPLDQDCIAQAPSLLDHLPKQDVERFHEVLKLLKEDYYLPNVEIDHRLVRGLDYYSHTCFEFVSLTDSLTVLAGGRYDGLAATLGYAKTSVPAIGWAAGLERLLLLVDDQATFDEKARRDVFLLIVPRYENDAVHDAEVSQEVARLALKTRREGFACRVWDADRTHAAVKKALKEADKNGIEYVTFVGWSEVNSRKLPVRHVASGMVKEVNIEDRVELWSRM